MIKNKVIKNSLPPLANTWYWILFLYLTMAGKPKRIDVLIDKLTNSIENSISGDSFKTEVLLLTKDDFKYIKNWGMVKEPKNIDFYTTGRQPSDKEFELVSEWIKNRKKQTKKRPLRPLKKKNQKAWSDIPSFFHSLFPPFHRILLKLVTNWLKQAIPN